MEYGKWAASEEGAAAVADALACYQTGLALHGAMQCHPLSVEVQVHIRNVTHHAQKGQPFHYAFDCWAVKAKM